MNRILLDLCRNSVLLALVWNAMAVHLAAGIQAHTTKPITCRIGMSDLFPSKPAHAYRFSIAIALVGKQL